MISRSCLLLLGALAGMGLTSGCIKDSYNLKTARPPGRDLILAKCGACHTIPDPHQLDSMTVEKILSDHHKRVRLLPSEHHAIHLYLLKGKHPRWR